MRFISHDEVHHLAGVIDPRYRAFVLLAGYGGLRLGELVFRSPDGKPIRASLFRKRYWTPAVNAAGLAPLRIHDLGHSAVSLWIAAGANPKQIAARAGHTSVSVVLDRYGHLYPDHDIDLIDTLEAHAQRAALR